jgi:hypothetical protein
MWTNDFWGTPLSHSGSHKSFRPLTTLTFRLNYYFSGFSPSPYHATNVALHTLTTWLFVRVARIIFSPALYHGGSRRGGGSSGSSNGRRRGGAVLLSSLLFACHPIHTEAVAGIVGRADVGSTALALTAFLAYVNHVKYRETALRLSEAERCPYRGKSRDSSGIWSLGSGSHAQARSLAFLSTSLLLAAAAMLTKEQGLTILLVCGAYDLIRSLIRSRRYQVRWESEWEINSSSRSAG